MVSDLVHLSLLRVYADRGLYLMITFNDIDISSAQISTLLSYKSEVNSLVSVCGSGWRQTTSFWRHQVRCSCARRPVVYHSNRCHSDLCRREKAQAVARSVRHCLLIRDVRSSGVLIWFLNCTIWYTSVMTDITLLISALFIRFIFLRVLFCLQVSSWSIPINSKQVSLWVFGTYSVIHLTQTKFWWPFSAEYRLCAFTYLQVIAQPMSVWDSLWGVKKKT